MSINDRACRSDEPVRQLVDLGPRIHAWNVHQGMEIGHHAKKLNRRSVGKLVLGQGPGIFDARIRQALQPDIIFHVDTVRPVRL